MDKQELMFMCDTLQGCVNRIMVTHDQEEMDNMFITAVTKINTIYVENIKRLGQEALNG